MLTDIMPDNSSRLVFDWQVGMQMGFNLQESLAAINQWVDQIDDDDDAFIAHRTDLLAKVIGVLIAIFLLKL